MNSTILYFYNFSDKFDISECFWNQLYVPLGVAQVCFNFEISYHTQLQDTQISFHHVDGKYVITTFVCFYNSFDKFDISECWNQLLGLPNVPLGVAQVNFNIEISYHTQLQDTQISFHHVIGKYVISTIVYFYNSYDK